LPMMFAIFVVKKLKVCGKKLKVQGNIF